MLSRREFSGLANYDCFFIAVPQFVSVLQATMTARDAAHEHFVVPAEEFLLSSARETPRQ
jgi:hypothetical protein